MLDDTLHTAAIRAVRNLANEAETAARTMDKAERRYVLAHLIADMRRLEVSLMPDGAADYGQPLTVYDGQGKATEYDTVLGFLARYDYLRLASMEDPVFETVALGRAAVHQCKLRRLPTLSVAAPKAISIRYSKVERVKAYPVDVLRSVIFGRAL